jgi:hypothetical protein
MTLPTRYNDVEVRPIPRKGEIVAIIPNVAPFPVTLYPAVDFLLIVEKVG